MAQSVFDASPAGQERGSRLYSTSPHSFSAPAESLKGTPDTRITSLSPNSTGIRSGKVPASLSIIPRGATPVKFSMAVAAPHDREHESDASENEYSSANLKDPFISTETSKLAQKLSPTASTFFPNHASQYQLAAPLDLLDKLPSLTNSSKSQISSFTAQTAGGTQYMAAAPTPPIAYVHSNLSTDTGLSRCLVVSKQGGSVHAPEVDTYIRDLMQSASPFEGTRQLHEYAEKVFIRFSNIRASCLVVSNLAMHGRGWTVKSISPREFSMVIDPLAGFVTSHEGQLFLSVFPLDPSHPPVMDNFQDAILALLRPEGDVFAFKSQTQTGPPGSLVNAVVEFCDEETVLKAVSKLHGRVFNDMHICMTLYQPDMPTAPKSDSDASLKSQTYDVADLCSSFQRMRVAQPEVPRQHARTAVYTTPIRTQLAPNYPLSSPYSIVPMVYHGIPLSPPYVAEHISRRANESTLASSRSLSSSSLFAASPKSFSSPESSAPGSFSPFGRRQHAMRVTRSSHHNAAGAHNVVDINRIREGTDVRTTIMLRNIPNKVDQAMLKGIIDESSWGKYDFMYLRIDFANDCNVGYAFINFVDPLDIIDFVSARGNQRWNCFKSDKVAEISYATIQGKDCLVQKFRNSSVMLEAEHYRPKLFFTLNGPRPDLAGEEEQFPSPDNPSKMKRSCENAEHVGLFTPNAGQHFRDEQRRRRSQFDRGTRFAAYEEYDHEPPVHRSLYVGQ